MFQTNLLAGRNAFCAGATSGINLAIAQAFAAHGAQVYVVSRNPDKVRDAIALIGPHAAGMAADVRDFDAITRAAAECHERGPIDIVLSGAAGNFLCRASDLSPKGFRTVIDIDLVGGFHVMKATYPHLRRPGASIINISALQSFITLPLQAHAAAAKAGLDALVKSLAQEWGPEGIRINSIAPGAVTGTEGMRRLAPDAAATASLTTETPLRRWATLADITNLALFLASPLSAYITGDIIVADGGYSLGKSYLGDAPSAPARAP